MTPAEELREAARLMRERANAAATGPWTVVHEKADGDTYVVSLLGQVTTGVHSEPGVSDLVLIERDGYDARYIASMHPLVALAVADWLDAIAWMINTDPDLIGRFGVDQAFATARAYLGSEREAVT